MPGLTPWNEGNCRLCQDTPHSFLPCRGRQGRVDGGEPGSVQMRYEINSWLRRQDGRWSAIDRCPWQGQTPPPEGFDHHHQCQHVRFDPLAAGARVGSPARWGYSVSVFQ